jgi:arylsulfatase A-like enzyme
MLKLAGAEIPEVFEGYDFSPLLFDSLATIRDEVYAEDHWHDFEDYTRAIRTERYKYIKNFYPDLPNTPSADSFRSDTYQAMLELNQKNSLNEFQMACFITPRPEEELYDIKEDPYELFNLAGDPEHGETLKMMREKLIEIRTKTNDVLPEKRTPDEFDRNTGLPTPDRIRPRPSKAEMSKK